MQHIKKVVRGIISPITVRFTRNRQTSPVAISVILALLLGSVCSQATAASTNRVIVTDFTSNAGRGYTKRITEEIVDALVNSGEFDVLEREKLHAVAEEFNFQAGALVDPTKAVEIGRMSGAQLLITGNVIENKSGKKSATSYGIRSTIHQYYLKVRVEVVDLTSGSKVFSHVADDFAELKQTGLNSVGRGHSSMGPRVAKKIVTAMLNNKRIKKIIAAPGGEAEPVSISIASVPEGADVEIDGVYLGNAGSTFNVKPGIHEIAVTLAGYEPWTKKVKVQDGLSFTANLSRKVE
ncbi:hypothetical protein AB833_31620 [Chromatiales bacterium (ex Bugula neritina AB1)]|nr:hypothetical protein AB833_31620 [Chromatiales bacterium (ex Bugula neritina AB1)]